MAVTITNKRPVLFAALMLTVIGNLSHLAGTSSIQSVDLHSFLTCDMDGGVRTNGVAECETKEQKIRDHVKIEKVTRQLPAASATTTTTSAPRTVEEYTVSSSLEASFCEDGSCTVSRTAKSLREAIELSKKLSKEHLQETAKKIREEKERLAKIERCEIDEDGEPITKEPKILKCLTANLKDMDEEKAADFYADNLKERIQKLLQSNSPTERALGMGALGQIGKDLDINCPSRPGLQPNQHNLLSHPNLNPMMNPMRPYSTAGTKPGAERDLIKESTCDMWAFGTYNNTIQHLQLVAANGAHRQEALHAAKLLKNSWGTYFDQRGLALIADPLGLNGMSGELQEDALQNRADLEKTFKEIEVRHKQLLTPVATAAADSRLARGAAVSPQTGTQSTAANPAARPAGMRAPPMGSPVGQPNGLTPRR